MRIKLRSGNLTSRLSVGDQIKTATYLLHPRASMAYGLLQVNPQAAMAFAEDEEMDARFDRMYTLTQEVLHCHGQPLDQTSLGWGFMRIRHHDLLGRTTRTTLRMI